MASRWQSKTHSYIFLLIILGFIGVVNYFSYKFFFRWDLTKDKAYTLSDSTRKVLAGLEDVVTIKAYISPDLPVPYNKLAQDTVDLLKEYEIYGKGNVKVEVIDPSREPDLEKDLQEQGVNKQVFPVRGAMDQGFIERYNSLIISYLDKNETFNNIAQIEDLEYTITMNIAKLTQAKDIQVGFFPGQEGSAPDPYKTLRDEVGKRYKVTTEKIEDGRYLSKDLNVLIMAGAGKVSDRQKYEIDQFIMRGGHVLFLLDGVIAVIQYWIAFPSQDNMDDMFQSYGVTRNHDLVMDEQNFGLPFLGPLRQSYPLWPYVAPAQLNALGQLNHPIVNKLDSVQLPYVSSLKSTLKAGDTAQGPVKAVTLLKTSPKAWVQVGGQGQFQINPQQPLPPALPVEGMKEGVRDLALLLTGDFDSFFKGQDVPAVEPGEDGKEKPMYPEGEKDRPERLDKSTGQNSLLIVGSSTFVADRYMQYIQSKDSNINFVLNTIDWMAVGGNLIGIRSRANVLRPLDPDKIKSYGMAVGLAGPLLVPVAMIIFGVTRSVVRRQSKKSYAEAVKKS